MLKIPAEGKLIDAGKFYQEAYRTYCQEKEKVSNRNSKELSDFIRFGESVTSIIGELAYDMPPVDAKPVIHGKWITKQHDDGYGPYPLFHCSECDGLSAKQRNYCSDCGAKMDLT